MSKYISLKEQGLDGKQLKQMSWDDLHAFAPIQEQFNRANPALGNYRDSLQAKYGDRLRLRVYSVIAVGFERLVWQELQT